MIIRLKLTESSGIKKIRSDSKIDNVIINENLLEPNKESVAIYFKGEKSSGILTLGKDEIEDLLNNVKPNLGLIKKAKRIRE